jgi:hypothetical protein
LVVVGDRRTAPAACREQHHGNCADNHRPLQEIVSAYVLLNRAALCHSTPHVLDFVSRVTARNFPRSIFDFENRIAELLELVHQNLGAVAGCVSDTFENASYRLQSGDQLANASSTGDA